MTQHILEVNTIFLLIGKMKNKYILIIILLLSLSLPVYADQCDDECIFQACYYYVATDHILRCQQIQLKCLQQCKQRKIIEAFLTRLEKILDRLIEEEE